MAKFRVNWRLEGLDGGPHAEGDEVHADHEAVVHLVANGVLTHLMDGGPSPKKRGRKAAAEEEGDAADEAEAEPGEG